MASLLISVSVPILVNLQRTFVIFLISSGTSHADIYFPLLIYSLS